ncbi:disintegrin and metalloproteinase domain-containing protein 28-like isoform X2 [Leptotrombidium deliense]|uniref:Disintegrin and metalloproteinase domain-containing protein 28-like isoform X2 n=1 Tax=Leptotrombidium deliense TaxID=299467 RepID=A0A443SQT6_9ACAR|nr:disintegrin and metalloproteinase domain-containing protein 28-like isoform X2 [Leptotrombidium deliense]
MKILAFNRTITLKLRENIDLIADNYFEKYHQNNSSIINRNFELKKNGIHCHFHGSLNNRDKNSWAALSTFNQSINGVISDGTDVYYIHYDSKKEKHFIFRGSDFIDSKHFKCGVQDDHKHDFSFRRRLRRSLNIPIADPYKHNTRRRYVELVIVNDHKEFLENHKDKSAVVERSKQIANIVNAHIPELILLANAFQLFSQLNIFVVLVGVVIWSNYDEIQLSSNGDKTLTNFLHYRRERLLPQHPNDNAQLITATSFDGGVVGKALKGPICTYEYSGGVNTDHSHIIGLVATTVAHELGHNFGMEHDGDNCKCADEKCIMAPSSSSTSPKHWSSCSIDYLNYAFSRGMDYCLRNIPKSIIGPVCGNGFLEKGEECDCGLKEYCDNPCCNAANCTLVFGAKCATGSCCDLSTCDVKKETSICREALSECDLPEFCDGLSQFCPKDTYIHDGVICGNHDAYCYNKYCKSHSSQCRLLWGKSGNVSDYHCFAQNTAGNSEGNCGYSRANQTYHSCATEDVLCGMLHCTHLNEKLELGVESAATLQESFITIGKRVFACRSAIIDLGLDSIDPGLVPNGAKCGDNKMCLNQKCVSVNSVLNVNGCENNCNGNGFCDNNGKCHCFDGFEAPNCEFSHGYRITLALYIIFLCILPLTSFSAFIAYYFQEHIKTWWIVKARKATIKTRAKEGAHRTHPRLPSRFDVHSLEISEPISFEESIDSATTASHKDFFKNQSFRKSLRGLEISAPIVLHDASNEVKVKPMRPAPPPPLQSGITRSVSNQSSLRHSSRRASYKRPKCPPPPLPDPPLSSLVNTRIQQLEEKTNVNCSNKSDSIQKVDCSINSEQMTDTPISSNENSRKNSAEFQSHSRVGLLTKQFETKMWRYRSLLSWPLLWNICDSSFG